MELKNGRNALIADEPEELAKSIEKLSEDKVLWKNLSKEEEI